MSHKLVLRAFIVMSLLIVLVVAPACASPQTTVYVAPSTMAVTVGQIFSVNVETSDVVDLYGWEFTLKWNPTFLDVLNVTEGEFLKSGGDTFFWSIMNNTDGYILADCTLTGNISGVNGSGTLSVVEFKAEKAGESILNLCDTKLVSSLEQPIDHTANNGTVTVTGSNPVGGIYIPVNKLELLSPYIGVTVLLAVAVTTIVFFKHKRKKL